MDLKNHLSLLTVPDRDALAAKCGTTRGHLQNVAYGLRPGSPELAVALERETGGAVRRWDLRPHDWNRIWPELVGMDGAPAVEAATAN